MKGTWKLMPHEKTDSQAVFLSQTNPKFTLTFTNTYLVKVTEEKKSKAYHYFWDPLQGFLTERTMQADRKLSIEVIEELGVENNEPKKQHLEIVNHKLRGKVDDLIKQVQSLQTICQTQEEHLERIANESRETRRDPQLTHYQQSPNNKMPSSAQVATPLTHRQPPYSPPHPIPRKWPMGPPPPRPYGSAPPHPTGRQYNPHFSLAPPSSYRPPPLMYDEGIPPREFSPWAPPMHGSSHNPSAPPPPHFQNQMRHPEHRYPPNSGRWAQPPPYPFQKGNPSSIHPPARSGRENIYRTTSPSGNEYSAPFPTNNLNWPPVRDGQHAGAQNNVRDSNHISEAPRSLRHRKNNMQHLRNHPGSRGTYKQEEENLNLGVQPSESFTNENMNSRPAH